MKMIGLLISALLISGCSQTIVPENLASGKFPKVEATRLSGETITLPDEFSSKPSILLVGYLQKAQFDIDRWLLGLLDAKIEANILEVPTIAGMIPGALSELIDSGMRSGIPKDDWYSVATVYTDAQKIIDVLGNQNPHLAHVVLLDKNGKILWHYFNGYSPREIFKIRELLKTNSTI